MIIYRPHRGSLFDAMKEAVEFETELEMKEHIVKEHNNLFFSDMISVEDIVIDDYAANDNRTGWKDTKYVCAKRIGAMVHKIPQCIGMCATDYK